MLMFNVYKNLRRITEKLTGYPCNPKLAKEYLWAWKYTGIRPHMIKWSTNYPNPSIFFKYGYVGYCASANISGNYTITGVDMDGFSESPAFKHRAYLIDKYLKMPKNCSKEEAVTFCAKAVTIDRDHRNEIIDFTGFSLNNCQHVVVRFF